MKIFCIFAALGLLVSAWAGKPKSIFSKIMSVLSCILEIALVIPILIYGDLDGAMWQVILLSSGLFVLFIPFLIFIIGFKYDKKIEEKERLKQAAIEEENKRKEEEAKKEQERIQAEKDRLINFYKECERRNIRRFKTEAEKQGLMLIAKKYNITDYEEALSVFQQGKDIIEAEESEKKRAAEEAKRKEQQLKLNAERAKESMIIEEERLFATLCGSDKYNHAINKAIAPYQQIYDEAKKKINEMNEKSAKIREAQEQTIKARVHEQFRPVSVQEDNWAIHGGIASAIAGPAAGLATALDIQRQNAEARAGAEAMKSANLTFYDFALSELEEMQSKVYEGSGDIYKDKRESEKAINCLKEQLDNINDRLLDDSDTEKKFRLLQFNEFNCIVRETGNIEVTGECILLENVNIATSKGFLDGSVKLTVTDKNNTAVAIGYYTKTGSVSGNEQTFNLDEWTFGHSIYSETKITALCETLPGKTISNTDGLTVTVEPIHMWVIEK